MAHNAAGHQGTDKTIARLSDLPTGLAWPRIYCAHCAKDLLRSLCHLPDGEGSSKTTGFPATNSDKQTMRNGRCRHPQIPYVK